MQEKEKNITNLTEEKQKLELQLQALENVMQEKEKNITNLTEEKQKLELQLQALENVMQEKEKNITNLTEEKQKLSDALSKTKTGNYEKKIKQKYKDKLQSLKTQMKVTCKEEITKVTGKYEKKLQQYKEKKETLLLNQCFTLVPPTDTFLVAKCCHLVLNLVGKLEVKIEDQTLNLAVNWFLESLKLSADVALLDILQALEAIIKTTAPRICSIDKLIKSLSEPIEERASLSGPQEVKIWRARCLQALASAVPLPITDIYTKSLFRLFEISKDLNANAQILKYAIEAVQTLCICCPEWLTKHLGEVLGVSMTYIHYGLANWQPKVPSKVLPLPGSQWEPQPSPVAKTNLKRHRALKSNQAMKNSDDILEEKPTSKLTPLDLNSIKWPASDSDMSDSEGGRISRLRRLQAKVRLAAVNLLLHVAKVIEIRELFGYYCVLLGRQGLAYSIIHEPTAKVTMSISSAICDLLSLAKAYLAQAQHTEMVSFTPFSGVLASLLTSLHQSVIIAFSSTTTPMSLLHCAAFLVDVTPYHRLQPELLSSLVKTAFPFIKHKDVDVSLAVLKFLGTVEAVEPKTEEQCLLLSTSPSDLQVPDTPSNCWLFNLALQQLSCENHVPLHVEWWQVLNNLICYHFDLVSNYIDVITTALLKDFQNKSELVQFHSARAFQRLAMTLAVREEYQNESLELWIKMLRGPLRALLAVSPSLSAAVCDCLADLGPTTYTQLPENLQILCITLLFGCCRHEVAYVRSAAVQALAKFVLCPSLTKDEQFMFDSSEIIKALVSDSVPAVAVKAAWALGNLTDILLKNQNCEEIMPPLHLIQTSLIVAQGHIKVRANGVRALGNLMGLIKKQHLSQQTYKNLPLNVATTLAQNAIAVNNMKVRWNACYAIGSMLKNEDLHLASDSWQGIVLNAVNGLVTRCSNFKVRANASSAISSVCKREYYGSNFIPAWKAILDGLENATNMSDFKEFKHQDGLLEQLCVSLCHLATLTGVQDLAALYDVLVFHTDVAKQHLSQFHDIAVPERTNIVLEATNHITELSHISDLSYNQKTVISMLSDILMQC